MKLTIDECTEILNCVNWIYLKIERKNQNLYNEIIQKLHKEIMKKISDERDRLIKEKIGDK